MQVHVVTLFPELYGTFLDTSLVKRAREQGALDVRLELLRRHGLGKHLSVDDTPYGGGPGMVLRVDCVAAALAAAEAGGPRTHRVLLTPQGKPFRQEIAVGLAAQPAVTLVCGRYEGFDERVRSLVDEEISLGDFVLAGGDVAAMAIIECCVRLLPGVLGNEDSGAFESFSELGGGLLEDPQYTRPAVYEGMAVPEILTSGDHAKIEAWRRDRSLERTRARRPDLLARKAPK